MRGQRPILWTFVLLGCLLAVPHAASADAVESAEAQAAATKLETIAADLDKLSAKLKDADFAKRLDVARQEGDQQRVAGILKEGGLGVPFEVDGPSLSRRMICISITLTTQGGTRITVRVCF